MLPVKVIHLIKRVEQIDREVNELHHLVGSIDSSRSYRNTMKIAAEQQINNLVGEKVKLMELKIENPPDFLTKQVFLTAEKGAPQPRVSLDALLGASTSTLPGERQPFMSQAEVAAPVANPLKNYARMMTVDEMLPKVSPDSLARPRRLDKSAPKTRAEILRDLPPLQY